MRFGSLFSGVGGFDLGFERAGMKCAWTVEYDKQARSVLRKHWPDVPHYEDVHNVGPSQLTPIQLLCGGFPCQDYSVAGKRGGLAGDRGALWWQMHRIIAECRPMWVVGENVPGLLSSNGGRDFLAIIGSLVQLGYGVTWATLDSQYWGVAQRRRRLFIVGHLGGIARPEILALSEGLHGHPAPSREAGESVAAYTPSSFGGYREGCGTLRSEGGDLGGGSENIVAHTLMANDHKGPDHNRDHNIVAFTPESVHMDGTREDGTHHPLRCSGHAAVAFNTTQVTHPTNRSNPQPGDPLAAGAHAPAIAFATQQTPKGFSSETVPTLQVPSRSGGGQPHAVLASVPRRLTPVECERLQGFPDGWTSKGITDEGDHKELADGPRYRMMGNAVTVNVAEWIGGRLPSEEV